MHGFELPIEIGFEPQTSKAAIAEDVQTVRGTDEQRVVHDFFGHDEWAHRCKRIV